MYQIKFLFIAFLFFLTIKSKAQNDCHDAISVCGNTGFEGLTVTGIGTQELSETNTCDSKENNSIWLKISIKNSGTLGFTLIPESDDINEDFDFFIFGPNASCNSLGRAIRCSTTNPMAAGQNNNHTGMNEIENDTSEGPGEKGSGFVQWLTVASGDSYFLVIDRPIGFSNFSLQWTGTATFNDSPSFNIPKRTGIDLEECDNDDVYDFSTFFDMTQNTPIIIGSQTDVVVTYHTNQNDATTNQNEIAKPDVYVNTSNPQIIYTRITNTITGCYNTTSFSLKINTFANLSKTESVICDDLVDGNDTNGQVLFDLNKVTSDVYYNQNVSNYSIKYYPSHTDASMDTNALPRFFYNTIPKKQTIFIKTQNNKGCFKIEQIDLIVNPLPQKINMTLVQCDIGLNPDGLTLFNLNEANSKLTNNNPNLTTDFFINTTDALNSINNLNTNYSNITNPQIISVKVTDKITGCSTLSSLVLNVKEIIEKNYYINPQCDNDNLEDGKHAFNLTEANISITNTQNITYYSNVNDALLEQNSITTPSSYVNETPYNQTIYARIEDGNECFGINTIKLEVLKLPNINIYAETLFCTNIPTYYILLDAGIQDGSPTSNYTYVWTKDNQVLAEKTNPTLKINSVGKYTVTIITPEGCEKTRTIVVNPSNAAQIETIAIVDLTEENTITVSVTGQGLYEYSLDAPLGPFQFSNAFDNVSAGIHEVYIIDKNGCGTVSKTIAVIGAPKFFTPNNDGFNDYWNIKGVNATLNSKSIIYIFDRYGKLLKQVLPSSQGWDGTFVGQPLKADDYWYTVKLEDGREAKGHFTLKR